MKRRQFLSFSAAALGVAGVPFPFDRLLAQAGATGFSRFTGDAQAVLEARHVLPPDDLLCITGSMYMAGVAREALLARAPAQSQRP